MPVFHTAVGEEADVSCARELLGSTSRGAVRCVAGRGVGVWEDGVEVVGDQGFVG